LHFPPEQERYLVLQLGFPFWLRIHYHLRTHSVRIRLGKTPEDQL
jgi:hypothetical protein